jgi:tetratricopeptide (TPR) repeat protein
MGVEAIMGLISVPDRALNRVLGWLGGIGTWVRDLVVGTREARWQRDVVSLPVANPDVFEGREDDFTRLKDLFANRNVVWITGPPGIGKTWFAGKFLHDEGLAEASCSFELGSEAGLQDLLESVNAFLVEKQTPIFDGSLRQPGLQPRQRIPALLRALAQTDFILVIESYEEVAGDEDVRELLRRAEERLPGARIIVTSQQAPGWPIEDRRIHLRGLRPEESRRLLAEVGVTERWQEIHDAVDGCPKGLRAAAGLAKTWGIDVAVEAAGRGDSPPLGLFEEVYARVMEPARRMWVMLTLLPGPFERETVLELWSDGNGPSAWTELVDCSVLDPREDRWQMHSLARATGGKQRPGQRRWRQDYGKKLALFYAQFAEEKAQDRAAVEAELENLLKAARLAFQYKEWDALWGMEHILSKALSRAWRLMDKEELAFMCYEGGVALGHPLVRAVCARNLGIAKQMVGKFQEARSLYLESLRMARRARNCVEELRAVHGLAGVAYACGDRDRAAKAFEALLDAYRSARDRPGEILVLTALGQAAGEKGDLEEAERRFAESLRKAAEEGDHAAQMRAQMGLGTVAGMRGEFGDAMSLWWDAATAHKEDTALVERARIFALMAFITEFMRPGMREAEELLTECLSVFRKAGAREHEAAFLFVAALLAETKSDVQGAVERMETAYRMFAERGHSATEEAKQHLDRLRKRLEEEG